MQVSSILLLISLLNQAYSTPISAAFDFKISTIQTSLKQRSNTCTDFIEFFINRCKKLNPLINALNTLNPTTLSEAHQLDTFFTTHNNTFKGPLHCIPVLIKDNINVAGLPTTGGITALRNSTPQADASLITRLKNAGAIVLAKANMAELAMGARYESEIGGACHNPYAFSHSCGASSSGSAAGVSAGLSPISLGSDTDASILNPASFCGVYGLRPPTNALDLAGVTPLFSRQDTVGPIAKHLDDLVTTYSVLKGDEAIFARYQQVSDARKIRVLHLGNFFQPFNVTLSSLGATFFYFLDEAVNKSMQNALVNIEKLGFELIDARLNESHFGELIQNVAQIIEAQFSTCAPCFFTVDLNRFLKNSDPSAPFHSIGEFLASPVLANFWKEFFSGSGAFDLNGDCSKECAVYDSAIRVFKADFVRRWFDSFGADVAVLPTMTNLPERIGEVDETRAGASFLSSYSAFAALNLPIDFSGEMIGAPDGLPIGLTVLAPPEKIEQAFAFAKMYSEAFIRVKVTPQNLNSAERASFNFFFILFLANLKLLI